MHLGRRRPSGAVVWPARCSRPQRTMPVDLGLGRVSLETEVDNEAARALYERCGFEPGEAGRQLRGLPRYVAYVKHLA